MNKTIIFLRWLSIPFVFLIVLLLVTGVLNFVTKIFNPGGTSDNIIMLIASGFGTFFAIRASFEITPTHSKNVLIGICGFAVFFFGMAFWNSIVKKEFIDMWGYVGNIAGLIIVFFSIDTELEKDSSPG